MKMKIELESQEEREEFERMQAQPSREQLMAEVAVLTELVRVLSDRVTELEGASNTLNEMRRRYDDHFAKALGRK
jgi:predicted nuclease with TOPRIM domain